MFFNISSRQIRKVHLYADVFIDEFSASRIKNPDEWNFLSYKAGFRLTDLPFTTCHSQLNSPILTRLPISIMSLQPPLKPTISTWVII